MSHSSLCLFLKLLFLISVFQLYTFYYYAFNSAIIFFLLYLICSLVHHQILFSDVVFSALEIPFMSLFILSTSHYFKVLSQSLSITQLFPTTILKFLLTNFLIFYITVSVFINWLGRVMNHIFPLLYVSSNY